VDLILQHLLSVFYLSDLGNCLRWMPIGVK